MEDNNKNIRRIKITYPLKVAGITLLILAVFTITCCIILGLTTPAGEQLPLIFLVIMFYVTAFVILFLFIFFAFYEGEWSKKHRVLNVSTIVICAFILITGFLKWVDSDSRYAITSHVITVNGEKYTKVVEYYDNEQTSIRSISFFLNKMKDSTWVVYDTTGHILIQKKYKKGKAIE
jgi:hypothetical protein